MRWVYFLLCLQLLTVVFCSSPTTGTITTPALETLAPEQLHQMVTRGEDFIFLDLRAPAEIQREGTLPNYRNIPIDQLNQRLSEIPRGKKIVAACRLGMRAALAAAYLRQHGFKDVVVVGMKEYKSKGYPLIHPKPGQ